MKFTTTIELGGKTATGMAVPENVVLSLGKGKRVPVTVTIKGYTYRSTVAPYAGDYMIPLSAEHREAAGVAAGDTVEVDIEFDDKPRIVDVPADFAKALAKDPKAHEAFEKLSYSHKRQHVLAIEAAKAQETRQRRIEGALAMLHEQSR